MTGHRHCSVVGAWDCAAPAGGPAGRPKALEPCDRCGEDVCTAPACSLLVRRPRKAARVRVCTTCLAVDIGQDVVDRCIADAYAQEATA